MMMIMYIYWPLSGVPSDASIFAAFDDLILWVQNKENGTTEYIRQVDALMKVGPQGERYTLVHGRSRVGQRFPLGRVIVPVVERDGVSTLNCRNIPAFDSSPPPARISLCNWASVIDGEIKFISGTYASIDL